LSAEGSVEYKEEREVLLADLNSKADFIAKTLESLLLTATTVSCYVTCIESILSSSPMFCLLWWRYIKSVDLISDQFSYLQQLQSNSVIPRSSKRLYTQLWGLCSSSSAKFSMPGSYL